MVENVASQKDLERMQGYLSHHISIELTSCVSEETEQNSCRLLKMSPICTSVCSYHTGHVIIIID